MKETDLWETFKKTGCVKDYLSYKGVYEKDVESAQPINKEVGEETFESVNQRNRDDSVSDTYW